ncbi:DUF2239 family protein [Dyella telluris]|uniref:DUF2239 family protein n=1 Tax=Dyella telluris TaxID=2763498 RepID=A0A7G8Q3W9_9GAMM|nr:DUF2239 family protein [Dyella telluris]QNK01477.1 DUF2239 family protein [Dyella telluris]
MTHARITPHDERNVRLLRRHWQWLEAQPRGVDATLRRMVDMARKDADGRYRAERARETCYLAMRDLAGDRPRFEEAVRALFANDIARCHREIAAWPLPERTRIIELMDVIDADDTTAGEA